MIKISVIVPVYNVEKYLPKCLDSLVNQTINDIEIIIVNDGTQDDSQKIIDEYYKKYPQKIKKFYKENGGLSSARNYGINYAQGEYIAFVDSDDTIKLDMFEKMYTKAKKDDLDIVVCDTVNVFEDKSEQYCKSNLVCADNIVKSYLLSPPMACIRIYKKYIFDNVRFKENILYEDLELIPSMVNITKKVGFVPEGLYYYYQRTGSIMNQTEFNIKLLDIFKVLENNYNKLYEEYPDEIEYMYITHLLRSASLRFVGYDDSKEYLKKINSLIKDLFPHWNKNKYFKQSSIKLKIICYTAYYKQYYLLRLLNRYR